MAKAIARPLRAVPRCLVCRHPDRKDIDYAIAGGAESNRCIAIRFGLLAGAVQRHRNNHVKPAIQRAVRRTEGHEQALAGVWEKRLEQTWAEQVRGATRAAASDKSDWVSGARWTAEMGRLCELGLRLEGKFGNEIRPTTVNQVILLPINTSRVMDVKTLDLPSSEDD